MTITDAEALARDFHNALIMAAESRPWLEEQLARMKPWDQEQQRVREWATAAATIVLANRQHERMLGRHE